jgi:peptidase E
MTAGEPTILATSGGFVPGHRTFLAPGPLVEEALALARPDEPDRRLRVAALTTAGGDQAAWQARLHEAFYGRDDVDLTVVTLFPMPNVDDLAGHLLSRDVIWAGGGSVANLLAVWAVHDLGPVMAQAWERGVVLSGVSAGSLCWHVGGTTDSFGPQLRPVTNGLALLPFGNGVHYDSEPGRRPLLHRLVGDGTLPASYATDDGAGLLYRGTTLVEAVADRRDAAAYRVERDAHGTVAETIIDPRRLIPRQRA